MAGETESIGLPPEATQPPVEAPTKNWFSKLLDKMTPHSQADALAGTTAGAILPEANSAMAAQVSKTEQPVLPPEPASVTK